MKSIMSPHEDYEALKHRAHFLSRRSLLELEIVINDVLDHELPRREEEGDFEWIRELVRILEMDDYALLDAILGVSNLGPEFDDEVLKTLQAYLPGKRIRYE